MSVNDLRPYPAYRESGADWLGRVPIHWKILPNRAVFREVRERGHPAAIMLSVTIKHGVIEQRALLSASNKKDSSNLDRSAYKLVCPGDIVYNKMRAWQGAIAASRHRGIVSPAYVVQRPNDGIDSRYLHHLLRIPAFAAEAERWSYGITSDMWSLRPEHFRLIRGCFPPLAEQRAIVRSLGAADRRIRRYIRAKERLIELLEERQRALIHEAVTGRIDVRTGQPYPAYRDSGVEWLGKVPEHWGVRKLRSLFQRHGSGTTPPEKEHFGGSVSWVMSGDLNDGKLDSTMRTVTRRAVSELPALKVYPPESLVVAMYGATIGRTGILSISACTNQACCVLADSFPDTSVPFVQAVLVLAREELVRSGVGGGQPNINAEMVRAFRVPSPPRSEQTAIAHFVDAADRRIQRHISATKRQIALLKEYRTRLIADVVTGKLDMREAAADLPETDPLARNRDRAQAIHPESNLHPTEHDMAKEVYA